MTGMREWIGYAESVEEALKRGLKKMGMTREDVQMDILSERTSSLFSMMDYRRVRVKLTAKPGVQIAEKPSRTEDRRRLDGQDRRQDRDRNFRDRRDREQQRGDDRRDERRRDRDRDRDQRFVGNRDTRNDRQDNRDNRRNDRNNRPPRDQNRPFQNQQRDNRQNQQERNRRQDNPQRNQPQGRTTQPSPLPSESTRPEIDQPTPLINAEAQSPVNLTPSAPSAPRKELPPMDSSTIETQLSRWKDLLGWEDLAWSVKPEEGRRLPVQFSTAKSDKLMGPRGETLEAFEYLFNLVLTQSAKDAPDVQFSMEGFQNPKDQRIIDLAKQAAAEVRRSRSVYRLDPMPPTDRKIVHQALANEPDVETVSEGEGPFRKVVVRLKSGAAAAPKKPNPWVR